MSEIPRRANHNVASTSCRVWHPSASAGVDGRVVLVVIDTVDEAAARVADYAERIPAAIHRALLVSPQLDDAHEPVWTGCLRDLPLQIVSASDPMAAVRTAVTDQLADTDVHHVVVLLAPTRCARSTSWRRLATALRRIDGVAPVLVPPASI